MLEDLTENTARENALNALVIVLQGAGFRFVSRQNIQPGMLADNLLPAVLIEEIHDNLTRETAPRHRNEFLTKCVVMMEIQGKAPEVRPDSRARLVRGRGPGPENGAMSTARNVTVRAALNALVQNPSLRVALTPGAEPASTVLDSALDFDVTYHNEEPPPNFKALVSVQFRLIEKFPAQGFVVTGGRFELTKPPAP
jgi:hypothetical protein